jgi:hypothetical protein
MYQQNLHSRASRNISTAVFGELADRGGIGGVQQQAQSIYFGEGVRLRSASRRIGLQRRVSMSLRQEKGEE